jgi:hypothetical protein
MGQSPFWETDSCSAGQEIPRLLWNPNVHYRVHKSPSLDLVLNQFNPADTLTPFFKGCYSVVSAFQAFPLKICMHYSFVPCLLHSPSVSSSLICSLQMAIPLAERSKARVVFDRWTLGSWVRIPLEAWIRIFLCSVLCRWREALRWVDPQSKESYQDIWRDS